DGPGSRVDVRSSSRYGSFDFGTNAARVRNLIDDIDDAIGAQKPEPAAAPASKKGKGPQSKAGQPPPRQREMPSSDGTPSVRTSPRATRSSKCARTESPAAFVSLGSRPT